MARASDVLDVAIKEIGYTEKKGNFTKYGAEYGLDGNYWCMMFVWWCFKKANASNLFTNTASCGALMNWAKQRGKWVTKDYKPGDVLIYDFPGNNIKTDHTGICEDYDGKYVTAIEGNTASGEAGSQSNGDGVYRKKRLVKYVIGAYRPAYEADYEDTLKQRAQLADSTMKYLKEYKYGKDLIRKLATMK